MEPSKHQQLLRDHPEFPKELVEPLTRLFRRREHINFRILPREAWMVVALLQFADRNPALGPEHHELLRWLAGILTEAIVNMEPIVEPYLKMGWDPSQDRPIDRKAK